MTTGRPPTGLSASRVSTGTFHQQLIFGVDAFDRDVVGLVEL